MFSSLFKHDNKINRLPRAVLFDYDGVLVASEIIHFAAWKQLLGELNLPYDTQLIQSKAGKTAPTILTEFLNLYRPGWDPKEYDVVKLAQTKGNYYLPIAQTSLQAYPGVYEGLEWLRSKNILMAVVSNARRRELTETLHQLKLFAYFNEVFSREDVANPKPDPGAYLTAAASLGVKPKECIVVEDSPTGLEAALLGKIPAAAVTTNFSRTDLEQPIPGRPDLKPSWIGESIEEFFQLLKTLES